MYLTSSEFLSKRSTTSWGGGMSCLQTSEICLLERFFSYSKPLHSKIYYIKITKMSDAKIAEFIKKLLQFKDKSESKYT